MLEKEFNYYLSRQDQMVEKYNGKTIVIIDEEVVGVYDSDEEALLATQKDHSLGTFLIQRCTPGSDSYAMTFRSRVRFD